jgi:hypothetical protein
VHEAPPQRVPERTPSIEPRPKAVCCIDFEQRLKSRKERAV